MKLIIKFTLFLILTISGASGYANEFPATVTTKLVTDSSSLDTDGIIRIGVLYDLKPGWHIYWKNSGDSGLPTKVEFTLPEGFEAGELLWPLPSAYKRAGNVLDYGYEDNVLLWTNVKVPADYDKNKILPVQVNTKWVSCEKICIPGKAELKTELNINNKNYDLFKKWEAKLPERNKNIESTIEEVKSDDYQAMYTINLNFNEPVQNIEFFPVPGKSLEIEDISYSNKDSRSKEISFKLYIYPGKVLVSDSLDSVITYRDKYGNRKGLEFPINVSNLNAKK
ncbi:MAG: protein-disulfide reductase DsbD domain-containing protein [Thermodesulfobacteriota bacterium]